jgi:hypothetical protein
MPDSPPRPGARRRSRIAALFARIAAAVRAANAGNVPF